MFNKTSTPHNSEVHKSEVHNMIIDILKDIFSDAPNYPYIDKLTPLQFREYQHFSEETRSYIYTKLDTLLQNKINIETERAIERIHHEIKREDFTKDIVKRINDMQIK